MTRAATRKFAAHQHEADGGADRAVDAGEDRAEDDGTGARMQGAPGEVAGDLTFVCG